MRKFIITGTALVALAVPSVAAAEYSPNPNASFSGQAHGAFGAIGAKGDRHDLGQGDTLGDAYLGANPATGLNNAQVMGNGTPEPHAPTTPLR